MPKPASNARLIFGAVAVTLAVVSLGIYLALTHILPGQAVQMEYPRSSWGNAGYATPEDAVETAVWAASQGDMQRMRQSLAPAFQQQIVNVPDNEILTDGDRADLANMTGFELVKKQNISESHVRMEMVFEGLPQKNNAKMDLQRVGLEWRISSKE